MAYDPENRPLSVTAAAAVTSYVYGADGARLKKTVHKLNCVSDCTDHTTLYFGNVEIQNWKEATGERIFDYPIPQIRLAFTTIGSTSYTWTALHRDALGSVRGVTGGADGLKDEIRVFPPYGSFAPASESYDSDALSTDDSKGYIGERFDAEAGLQYLNARYYDSKLAMFIQSDWWDVTAPGVGTNRYAYGGDAGQSRLAYAPAN